MSYSVSVKRPGDREVSPLGLLLNLRFLFGFLRYIPISALKLVLEYGKMEEELRNRYYSPETDVYPQAICVRKQSRGTGALLQAISQLDAGGPVYCETHTKRNVRLYKKLGLTICEEQEWHGVTHTVMKRQSLKEKVIK